jgi:hypothetical protein
MDDLGNYLTQPNIRQTVFEARDGRRLIVMFANDDGPPTTLRFWFKDGSGHVDVQPNCHNPDVNLFNILGINYMTDKLDEDLQTMLTTLTTFSTFEATIWNSLMSNNPTLSGKSGPVEDPKKIYPINWFSDGVMEAEQSDSESSDHGMADDSDHAQSDSERSDDGMADDSDHAQSDSESSDDDMANDGNDAQSLHVRVDNNILSASISPSLDNQIREMMRNGSGELQVMNDNCNP